MFGPHVLLHYVVHQNQNTDAVTYLSRHDYCRQLSVLYLKYKNGKENENKICEIERESDGTTRTTANECVEEEIRRRKNE